MTEATDSYSVFMEQRRENRLHFARKVLYPVVRVRTKKAGGSGTVVWSREVGGDYKTFVLTNHHVVSDLIKVEDKYNPLLKRKIPTETRGTAEVEFFRYYRVSRIEGAYSVKADVVAYDEKQDIALLELRMASQAEHVALLPPPEREKDIMLYDQVVAVGATLGHEPLITDGHINFLDDEMDEHEYWLSSAPIHFGSSGGAVFLSDTLEFMGMPSRVAVASLGWSADVATHLAYFIPVFRVFKWLDDQFYTFIFSDEFTYEGCEKERKQTQEEKSRLIDVQEARRTEVGVSNTNKYYSSQLPELPD